ncbi:unnamed protein product [Polarella glacialis]|uniref:Uncharacterized protein n=1 Tax=Polarella glacialis TaxID=89957 RepID=A0A813HW27_POLGL|nr:unnamed protein product [Polarella glacialis]
MQDPSATLVQEIHSWVASTCSKGLAKQPPLGWLDRSFKLPVGTTEEHFRLFFRASKLPQSLELDFPKPGGLVHVILRAEAQREYEAAQTGGRTVTLPRRSPRIAGQSCAVSASSSLGEKPQSRASRGAKRAADEALPGLGEDVDMDEQKAMLAQFKQQQQQQERQQQQQPPPLQAPSRELLQQDDGVHVGQIDISLEPDGAMPLSGVIALPIGLNRDQEELVRNTLLAFGGRTASSLEQATHGLVPPELSTAEWEKLKHLNKKVFAISWLQEVMENGLSASSADQALAHVPDFVQQLAIMPGRPRGRKAPAGDFRLPLQQGEAQTPKAADQRHRKQSLAISLQETMEFLKKECPEEVAGQVRLAIERSLQFFAVQLRTVQARKKSRKTCLVFQRVRAAYRKKAIALHPDKGGNSRDFDRLQKAYRLQGESMPTGDGDLTQQRKALPDSDDAEKRRDFDLRDHRALVKEKFERDGVDLDESWIGDDARSMRETALSMKRVIEAAVLTEHPDWAGVGEDVQAFSDFLFYVLGTNPLLNGHYQALVPCERSKCPVYKPMSERCPVYKQMYERLRGKIDFANSFTHIEAHDEHVTARYSARVLGIPSPGVIGSPRPGNNTRPPLPKGGA